jgi:hypothetical protein
MADAGPPRRARCPRPCASVTGAAMTRRRLGIEVKRPAWLRESRHELGPHTGVTARVAATPGPVSSAASLAAEAGWGALL